MIHVLGFGSIGRLVAHTIRSRGIPTTILLRGDAGARYAENWSLTVKSHFDEVEKVGSSSGYHFASSSIEDSLPPRPMKTLIVCTKAFQTSRALQKIVGRLDDTSNVLLLNNGIGVKEEIFELLKTKSNCQVTIFEGILSHGVYPIDEGTICHAGKGSFFLSTGSSCRKASLELGVLCDALSSLECVTLDYPTFKHRQLEKLLVNAAINPITAIVQCNNGVVSQFPLAIDAILSESVGILSKAYPDISIDKHSVRETVNEVIVKTSKNTSSMLQDILAGRPTEIDYINGALCKLAASVGLDASINQILVDRVRSTSERGHTSVTVDMEQLLGLE